MVEELDTLPDWRLGRCIGQGSFGKVYEIRREAFGIQERAALKVLHIPQDPSLIEQLRVADMDDASITRLFDKQAEEIIREYQLMMGLKNSPYIVHCQDLKVERQGLGVTLLLRMELLTPLVQALAQNRVKEQMQILRLGSNLCAALETCRRQNILHRDVKPQNIFLAPDGSFKLGDFGIARSIEAGGQATVGVGTQNFMAPEVLFDGSYDSRADIYSLGMVLYWLLNHYRGPFLPPAPEAVTAQDLEAARTRRFSGEPLPPPAQGSRELQAIVLKACSFHPEQRYATAAQMQRDLDALAEGDLEQITVRPSGSGRGRKWPVLLAAVLLLLFTGAVLLTRKREAPPPEVPETTIATEPAQPNTSGLSFSLSPGTYQERIRLEITAQDPEAQIWYCLTAREDTVPDSDQFSYYEGSIFLSHGSTTVHAYAVKGRIAGDRITATYHLEYPQTEVTFQDPAMEEAVRRRTGYGKTIDNYSCEQLDYLHIDESMGQELTSLADLQQLPGLRYLSISGNWAIDDWSYLEYCPDITVLDLEGLSLSTLEDMQRLPLLRNLILTSCQVDDMSALGKLSRLFSLTIDTAQLTDFDLLLELPQLSTLNLDGLNGLDYQVLGQLTGLYSLSLHLDDGRETSASAELTDLSFLQNIFRLRELSIEGLRDPAQLEYIRQSTSLIQLTYSHCPALEEEGVLESLQEALPDCSIQKEGAP